MSADDRHAQALAGLRVLIHLCRADGAFSEGERAAITQSMDALELDEDQRAVLFEEEADLDDALARVTDEEVRRAVILAAYAVARSDGSAEPERQMIERARASWGVEVTRHGLLDELRAQLHEDFGADEPKVIADPEERQARVARLIRSRAIGLAVLAVVPTNLVTEALGAYFQLEMVRTIGRHHGHAGDSKITRALVASLLGVVALHAGLEALVRLVPGWGSAIGIAASYGTTWGLGWAAQEYFEAGGELDDQALLRAFRSFRERGERAYSEHEADDEAGWRGRKTDISELTRRFLRGEASARELTGKFKDDLDA